MEKLIEYVQRVFEDKYWLDDGLQEESIDEFVIRVSGSDDESSSESSSESSDESVIIIVNACLSTISLAIYLTNHLCNSVALFLCFAVTIVLYNCIFL